MNEDWSSRDVIDSAFARKKDKEAKMNSRPLSERLRCVTGYSIEKLQKLVDDAAALEQERNELLRMNRAILEEGKREVDRLQELLMEQGIDSEIVYRVRAVLGGDDE